MDIDQGEQFDPLLSCLEIMCRLQDITFSAQSAVAGLPIERSGMTPGDFVRAAKHVGIAAHLHKRPLDKLSNLVLPVVLILHNKNACVLTHFNSNNTVDLYLPENPEEKRTLPLSDLRSQFTGHVIYGTANHDYEQRSEQLIERHHKSWFWGIVFEYKWIFFNVFLAALITNTFVLVSPIYIMNVYDRVIPNFALDTLSVLTIGAMIFFVFDFAARFMRAYLIDIAGKRADFILSSELFERVLSLKMKSKPASSGAFASYFSEFESLRDFFTSATIVTFIDLPFIFLFLFVMWYIGGSIIIVPIVLIPFIVIFTMLIEIPTKRAMKESLTGSTQKNAIVVEAVNGMETLKSLCAEGIMQKHWEESIANQSRATMKARNLNNLTFNITIWAQQIAIIGTVFYGVFLIQDKAMTVGTLVACTILVGRIMLLGPAVTLMTRLTRSLESLKTLNRIMTLPYERSSEHKYLHRPHLNGNIEFKSVHFIYPKRRLAAIDNISFSVKAGEHVGIIGKIGSGKSTLMKLLISLYEPDAGSITVDGTEVNEIDPADLRANIRYISSDSTLFYGTIKNNILMGKQLGSDEEIVKASKLAGIEDFISQSPLGYDMPVGELGESLSSGQRQAIMLARALIGDTSILLLDEPTAAVDNSFEKDLVTRLKPYLENKTVILSTHRLPMLDLVDRLIVIDKGKIIADGPKETVLESLKQKNT